MTQYLQEAGYEVWNLSQPGGDMTGLANLFRRIVQCNPHKDFLPVLIQTDIGRSFPFREFLMKDEETVTDFLNRVYLEIYQDFNNFAKELNVNVHVIGGLTDITVNLSTFSNLRLIGSSWVSLINPGISMVQVVDQDSINYLDWKYKDKKNQLVDIIDKSTQRFKFFDDNPIFFYPDGQHPNRDMHRVLADYLLDYFKTGNHV